MTFSFINMFDGWKVSWENKMLRRSPIILCWTADAKHGREKIPSSIIIILPVWLKKNQSSFHSVLDCFQLLSTEFSNIAAEISLTIYTIVNEKHEQNVMITYGKLQTIVITSDLKQEMQDISVQHYMWTIAGYGKKNQI